MPNTNMTLESIISAPEELSNMTLESIMSAPEEVSAILLQAMEARPRIRAKTMEQVESQGKAFMERVSTRMSASLNARYEVWLLMDTILAIRRAGANPSTSDLIAAGMNRSSAQFYAEDPEPYVAVEKLLVERGILSPRRKRCRAKVS